MSLGWIKEEGKWDKLQHWFISASQLQIPWTQPVRLSTAIPPTVMACVFKLLLGGYLGTAARRGNNIVLLESWETKCEETLEDHLEPMTALDDGRIYGGFVFAVVFWFCLICGFSRRSSRCPGTHHSIPPNSGSSHFCLLNSQSTVMSLTPAPCGICKCRIDSWNRKAVE